MQPEQVTAAIQDAFAEAQPEAAGGAIFIDKNRLSELSRFLRDSPLSFDELHCVTAVDNKVTVDLVYIYNSTALLHQQIIKVRLEKTDLTAPSLTGLWKSADWFEREVYDLFGVVFAGHGNLKRILNPDDWQGYPLRKDYSDPNFTAKPRY
ncbi:MAG: NADH-quinone oxidoreductase subunit C [Candidatus Omnitrophota bacterium]